VADLRQVFPFAPERKVVVKKKKKKKVGGGIEAEV
jgi:hypothetical protein